VIFLSAKGSVEDKISGLQAGGDDYLSKPFSFTELLARIQAMLRRAQSLSQPTQLTVADLTIDLLTRKVSRAGKRIELQPQEYSLLEYLMKNTGKIVSRTMILEHVWEYNFDPQTNIVETRLCRLREKIDKEFERKLIRTVRGFGYVLE
jgi:two-component system OmpR family response regulator